MKIQNRIRFHGIFLIFILNISVSAAFAQNAADSTIIERIRFLQKSLSSDQRAAKQWWSGWLAGYGVATIGQGIVCFSSDDKAMKQDMAVGAITTFAGVLGQFISPFQPASFVDQLAQMPDDDPTSRLVKLTQMEKILADRSRMEIETRRWKAHILCTSVNLASGMVTWLGFHRTVWDGVANFALNCVITEAQIWSQPLKAKKELKRYHERFGKESLTQQSSREIQLNFVVSANGAGVKILF